MAFWQFLWRFLRSGNPNDSSGVPVVPMTAPRHSGTDMNPFGNYPSDLSGISTNARGLMQDCFPEDPRCGYCSQTNVRPFRNFFLEEAA